MKAHRKLNGYKGCSNDPDKQEVYCSEHLAHLYIIDNKQELFHDDEYHIEKILRRVMKKGYFHYELKWENFEQHTMEPRGNIPRIQEKKR